MVTAVDIFVNHPLGHYILALNIFPSFFFLLILFGFKGFQKFLFYQFLFQK